jgi:selenide,water dikinase
VYALNEELCIVQTVDFITPVVDDPFDFGEIAVANALSDIYAMGAVPLFALNILMFATCNLSQEVLKKIVEGGAKKLKEAGVSIIGGHSIDDLETKYGLAVSGIVKKNAVVRNSTAKVGDLLIYTKPLGIGVITTALKVDLATPEQVETVTKIMKELNRTASEIMVKVGVNACTDITGFGFLGHLYEMVKASNVSAVVYADSFEYIEGSKEFASMGIIPAATYNNMDYVEGSVEFKDVDEDTKVLLFDPQTSGGLLISVDKDKAENLLELLKSNGVKWAKIVGEVKEGTGIVVRGGKF